MQKKYVEGNEEETFAKFSPPVFLVLPVEAAKKVWKKVSQKFPKNRLLLRPK